MSDHWALYAALHKARRAAEVPFDEARDDVVRCGKVLECCIYPCTCIVA